MASVRYPTPAIVMLACAACCQASAAPLVLRADAFGVVGDGVTDDGPAIARLLAAASEADRPVRLQFPPRRTYYVKTSPERYVFPIRARRNWTLDGGRSTFVLDPYLRFLSLTDSRDITIRRLNVDFRPLPFVDGTVIAVSPTGRYLDVRLAPGVAEAPVGGPTGEDGEQAFFSMLWFDGPYGTLSQHYWTERIEAGEQPGTARVFAGADFQAFDQVQPGSWRISLPVPGIAHRYGPGPCFAITDNDKVTLEDVELWSAPWFGFQVARNEGALVFRRVSIRPRPRSGRLMSVWRDGFHVKGNRASLLWEDCTLAGMNDDAFNISTHSSAVERVDSPTRIEVRQKFPLLFIPWREGATLIAADEAAACLLGAARLLGVQTGPAPEPIQGLPAAPATTLTLDRPIAGLAPGTMVWDPGSCNPDTTLRRCRISMSCRLQSPVRLERCDVNALLWFYCEHVEGGFPSNVTIRNCVLRRGRGNPTFAVVFSGAPTSDAASPEDSARPRAIHDVLLAGNRIYGGLRIEGVERVTLTGNRFLEPNAPLILRDNYDLDVSPTLTP